jgi:hypothetical protein
MLASELVRLTSSQQGRSRAREGCQILPLSFLATMTYSICCPQLKQMGLPTPAVSPSLFTSPTRIWASCGIVVPMFQIDVTGVFVSFIQPRIISNSALASDQEARFFGGIDGYTYRPSTMSGTDVLCKTRGGRSPSTLEYRRVQAVSQQSR